MSTIRVALAEDNVLLRADRNPNTTGCLDQGIGRDGVDAIPGIEAQIPVNRASGHHTGVLLQAHLYLDGPLIDPIIRAAPRTR